MSHDPEQERARLEALYAAMSEGELRQVAGDAGDLTDIARAALATEGKRRNVDLVSADSGAGDEIEFREMVTLRQFRDLPEALLAKGRLDSAGIECTLVDENMVRMDWFISNLLGGVKLEVNKSDAEEALALLSESTPENFEVEGSGTYEQPRCPKCGSIEITHEAGIDKRFALPLLGLGIPIPIPVPRDDWKCDVCGAAWEDAGPDDPLN